MESSFESALVLLLIGMITVFGVLLLVVVVSKALIGLVNRFFPLPHVPAPADPAALSGSKLAAIAAAVEIVTGGRGHIESIKKESGPTSTGT